uniref:Uncharacterized protein n=1 Tax=Panagrolaimus superbus TaxID=310955 RepID=A0A914ZB69_9BILA
MFCTEAGPPTLFNFVATVLLPKAKTRKSKADITANEDLINLLAPRRRQVSRLPFRFGCNAKILTLFD